MAKGASGGSKGGGGGSKGGGSGKGAGGGKGGQGQGGNWPSTTGEPSGGGRGNAPSKARLRRQADQLARMRVEVVVVEAHVALGAVGCTWGPTWPRRWSGDRGRRAQPSPRGRRQSARPRRPRHRRRRRRPPSPVPPRQSTGETERAVGMAHGTGTKYRLMPWPRSSRSAWVTGEGAEQVRGRISASSLTTLPKPPEGSRGRLSWRRPESNSRTAGAPSKTSCCPARTFYVSPSQDTGSWRNNCVMCPLTSTQPSRSHATLLRAA